MGTPDPAIIKVRDHGPYKVTGPVRIIDVDGTAYDLPEGPVVLCRCGHSQTKPFCDGSHKAAGFSDSSRATPGAPARSDG